jgi:hypothetical protein
MTRPLASGYLTKGHAILCGLHTLAGVMSDLQQANQFYPLFSHIYQD